MTIEDDLESLFPHPLLLDQPALVAYAKMRSAEDEWLIEAEASEHQVHHLATPAVGGVERLRRQTVVIDTGANLPSIDEVMKTRKAFSTHIARLLPKYRAGERTTALPAWSTPDGLVPITSSRPEVPVADGVTYRSKTAWRGKALSFDACIGYLERRHKTLLRHAKNYRAQYKKTRAEEIEARAAAIVNALDSLRQMPATGSISARVRSGQALLFRVHVGSTSWESSTPNVLIVRGTPETTFAESTRTRHVESHSTLITTIEGVQIFTTDTGGHS